MTKNNPKYRWPLNDDQLEILELLYKFRFGSNNLIAEYFGKNHRAFASNRLKVLEEQGFIGKRFDSSYRIQGKPAAYYLRADGARKLQERRDNKDEVNIKSIYKDKTVSEGFIWHSLNIFAAYNQLKARYGSKLDYFTKSDLASYQHFPKPLPDVFLSLEIKDTTKHFFMELIENSKPFFTAVRTIKKYIDYKQSGNWALTEADFPVILFVCDSTSWQKQLQKQIVKMLSKTLIDDLVFAATTKEELKHVKDNQKIWQSAREPDIKLSLQDIQ